MFKILYPGGIRAPLNQKTVSLQKMNNYCPLLDCSGVVHCKKCERSCFLKEQVLKITHLFSLPSLLLTCLITTSKFLFPNCLHNNSKNKRFSNVRKLWLDTLLWSLLSAGKLNIVCSLFAEDLGNLTPFAMTEGYCKTHVEGKANGLL